MGISNSILERLETSFTTDDNCLSFLKSLITTFPSWKDEEVSRSILIILCEKSLGTLEESLPDHFIRIHRSYIINKTWIAEIHRYFKGRLMLVMDDKERTTVITSDSYTQDVKSSLGL